MSVYMQDFILDVHGLLQTGTFLIPLIIQPHKAQDTWEEKGAAAAKYDLISAL